MEERGCELSCAGFCSSLRRLGASIGLANCLRSLEMPQAASSTCFRHANAVFLRYLCRSKFHSMSLALPAVGPRTRFSNKKQQAYLAELRRQTERDEKKKRQKIKQNFVYYCAWEDRPDAIKIGFTTNVLERMKSFLTGSPSDLWLLAVQHVNHIEEEYALHNRFEKYKIRGEWFHMEADLFSHVASLDQTLALEQFQEFPEHYQSFIYVPCLSHFVEINL